MITIMTMITWLILGLLSGFVVSKVIDRSGLDIPLDLVVGMVGAVLGGWAFTRVSDATMLGFAYYSMLFAVVGSVVVVLIFHTVRRSR